MHPRTSQEINCEIQTLIKSIRDLSTEHKQTYNSWPQSLFEGKGWIPDAELLERARIVGDRIDIIKRMPKKCMFAEIGTLTGNFALRVAEILRPSELHIFDLSLQHIKPETMAGLSRHVVGWHIGLSWEKMAEMPPDHFDVVYIDADHSLAAVTKDAAAAYRIVRPGGHLIFNDYTGWGQTECRPYGVFSAANKLANDKRLKMRYLALQASGYYHAAFQIPDEKR